MRTLTWEGTEFGNFILHYIVEIRAHWVETKSFETITLDIITGFFRILKAPAVQTFATANNCGFLTVIYSIQHF